ncbi:EndoU domain-containing protein [Thalassospira sp.]|uniref:EndoU domain-containing protein n=1 Tax=Thalassospira sp. TaxID=1912094 RepID=UPI003AA81C87
MQNKFCTFRWLSPPIIFATAMFLTMTMAFARPASARINCTTLTRLATVDHIDINQRHVFCGEIGRYGAVGFHSQPDGETPDTVKFDAYSSALVLSHPDHGQWHTNGIYELNNFLVSDGIDQLNKTRSTMFPDHCTMNNVLDAIAHAARHNNMSGPTCLTTQNRQFEIRLFWLYANPTGWYVNTAYPRL